MKAAATAQPRALIVADDPIEAGMLALDLVQAGVQAQAVRDVPAALQQVRQAIDMAAPLLPVVVTAFRQVGETVRLWNQLTELGPRPGMVVVVFPEQHATVETLAAERGLDVKTAGLEKLDALWDEVKRGEA